MKQIRQNTNEHLIVHSKVNKRKCFESNGSNKYLVTDDISHAIKWTFCYFGENTTVVWLIK